MLSTAKPTIKKNELNISRTTGEIFSKLLAWIICPIVILFSYMPLLNIYARAAFVALVLWFFLQIMSGRKIFYWIPPLVLFLIWGIYSLVPSMIAININISLSKWITVLLLGLVSLSVAHAVAWSGLRSWAWAYSVSCILCIGSNYLPIHSYLAIDYDTEQFGRTVGTFGNSNTYGRVMVEAALLAIFLLLQEKSKFLKFILYGFVVAFGIAVLQSGSRTALIGLLLVLLAAFHSTGWSVFRLRNLPLNIMALLSITLSIIYQPDKFLPMLERMNILLSYFGLVEKIETRDRSMSLREGLISNAWNTWLDHPMGVGLDNYKLISGVYAHSNYFELLASVGIIGLFIYYLSYWYFYRWTKSLKSLFLNIAQYKLILATIFITMVMDISNVSYYSKPLWLLIAILTGFIASQSKQKNNYA